MTKQEAIFKLYPQVTIIRNDDAYDINGNQIIYNEVDVFAVMAANEYKAKRASAYPSIADQLDKIYHEGIDAWKAQIAAIKTEYPKP